jgi:hypothetical protein
MDRSRTSRIVRWLAGAAVLATVAVAGADRMRDCVEQGGTYFNDGHCEVAREDPAHACRRQGGRYVGNGRCEFAPTEQQQVDACKQAGGILMQAGRCYGPAKRR